MIASDSFAALRKSRLRLWARRCEVPELVTAVRSTDFDRAATLIRHSEAPLLALSFST